MQEKDEVLYCKQAVILGDSYTVSICDERWRHLVSLCQTTVFHFIEHDQIMKSPLTGNIEKAEKASLFTSLVASNGIAL